MKRALCCFLPADLAGQFETLSLPARQGVDGLPEPQIAETDRGQHLEGLRDLATVRKKAQGLRYRHGEDIRDGFSAISNVKQRRSKTSAAAGAALDIDVREKLHLDLLEPLALAGLATAAALGHGRVERKGRCRELPLLCDRPRCQQRADRLEGLQIGDRCGPRGLGDRRLVHEDDLVDSLGAVEPGKASRLFLDVALELLDAAIEDIDPQRALPRP